MRQQSTLLRAAGRPKPTLRIPQLRRALGRSGHSIRGYDIEHVATLMGADGHAAYGASPHDGYGRPFVGARGRPLIQISNLALRDMRTAVITIFHEIAHHRSYRAVGHGGTETEAEWYGQRMYEAFARHYF